MEGLRGFGEMKRVGWGAAENGSFESGEVLEPSRRGLSTGRVGRGSETVGGFEGGPEAEERAEGEREEDAVGWGDSEGVETENPVVEHPVPVCSGIGNKQGRCGGPAGLGDARVLARGACEI